jgi:hypothetical protein
VNWLSTYGYSVFESFPFLRLTPWSYSRFRFAVFVVIGRFCLVVLKAGSQCSYKLLLRGVFTPFKLFWRGVGAGGAPISFHSGESLLHKLLWRGVGAPISFYSGESVLHKLLWRGEGTPISF